MKHAILILSFIFSYIIISAQVNIIELHPSVGDTIDKVELKKYHLFYEYSNDSVDYVILNEIDSLYYLYSYHSNTLILMTQIDEELLLKQKANIEKLNKYFTTVNDKDSVDIIFNNELLNTQIDLNYRTPEFYKSIKKENKRKFWRQKREETRKNRENGMVF